MLVLTVCSLVILSNHLSTVVPEFQQRFLDFSSVFWFIWIVWPTAGVGQLPGNNAKYIEATHFHRQRKLRQSVVLAVRYTKQ
jgi:hypothetical protein